tara:strand:- start:2246 stop:3088 length:843 start_codon:yes stop_codon:yes gene_type:complete
MKKVRHKHNKKRNTAFVYEALIKELTESVVQKDQNRKKEIVSIIKEHFKKGTFLRKELDLYKSLYETKNVDVYTAERILEAAKKEYDQKIDKEKLFVEQTNLIKRVSKDLSSKVFSNFVSNYKFIATISQVFKDIPTTDKVLLESVVVKKMATLEVKSEEDEFKPISSLALKTFVKNFNDSYSGVLSEDQKKLIQKYIVSYGDDGLEFKLYLNQQLGALREQVDNMANSSEVAEEQEIKEKFDSVLKMMENFKQSDINKELLTKVLKIQNLVKENQENVN